MRTNFRIHPVIVPGEIYELRFVNNGVVGRFLFLGKQKYFCVFQNESGEIVRVLYENIRWARG